MSREMFDRVTGFLDGLRVADVADVVVLAGFFFLILNWLRRTAYPRLLSALLLLIVGLVSARALGMYLTELVLRGLVIVAGLALIVVFQEEIRRFFERMTVAGSRGESSPGGQEQLTRDVVEAAFDMADAKVGALMVFRGKEPLERLVSGGIPLDGRVSPTLLKSIFQPASPGHDGAVIVEGGRLTLFATHLPLSKEPPTASTGTRHAAALGISERSDALVVVVSEERGEVSLVEDGRLSPVEKPGALEDRLDEFFALQQRGRAIAPSGTYLLATAGLAIASIGLASAFWFLFPNRVETVQRNLVIPIEHRNLPDNLSLESPSVAEVTLSGSSRAFAALDAASLAVSLEASAMSPGEHEIAIVAENVALPPGLAVRRIEPDALTVVVRELVRIRLPVSVRTRGRVPVPWVLDSLESEPDAVSLWAPKENVAGLREVPTETIDLASVDGAEVRRVSLLAPENCRLVDGETEVVVRIRTSRSRPR